MKIAINRIHFPVTTLGYGRRLGIWTQGCSIRCPGCVSRDTWERDAGREVEIADLIAECSRWLSHADGVTVSGGEPFDQPDALAALLAAMRAHCEGDILVFSGYSREWLFAQHAGIVAAIDVIVSDPFRSGAGERLILRGSDNQRVTLLSDLARERYPADIDSREWEAARRLDLVVSNDEVWMAGIPRRGELERLRARLMERGFHARTSEQAVVRP